MAMYNQDITYDELVVMLQRVFSGHIDKQDTIALKYMDDGVFMSS